MMNLAKNLEDVEPKNGEYVTIAIDGRGASGKSALAEFLGTELEGFTIINGDDFFEPHNHPITWGEFNERRFQDEVLLPVKSGLRLFDVRSFNFPKDSLDPPKQIDIKQGVIIERCFSFELPVDWDLKIWVETPDKICLERGLEREGAKLLGKRAIVAWTQIWQPKESLYISKFQPLNIADYVINGIEPFNKANWVPRNSLSKTK